MTQREITLWVDERWCKALEKHLLDGTVTEKLEEHIDELVNKLPENVYERISSEIWQEREQARIEAEAARRFAVLHVTEGGNSIYFVAEENLDMLHVRRGSAATHENRLRILPHALPECFPREKKYPVISSMPMCRNGWRSQDEWSVLTKSTWTRDALTVCMLQMAGSASASRM